MTTSFLNTLAAGILTCVSLTGTLQSASAQFFDNDGIGTPNSRPPASQYNDGYGRHVPPQWQDRAGMDPRYIRTNSADGAGPRDDFRPSQERCTGGQCQLNRGERTMNNGTASYGGRRGRSNGLADGNGYQSRRAMTTGWDPSNPDAIDPATGLPMQRSYRGGHDHADGERHGGHGRCHDCVNGQCDCPEGQCTCPDGQRGTRGFDPRNAPASYDEFNLTRRNTIPQYVPTRSPYMN